MEIQGRIKKQLPDSYPKKLDHILLGCAWIKEIERKQVVIRKQLTLFQGTEKRPQ